MEKIKVCPKCGSTNITIPPAGLDLRMSVPDYCNKCGERGTFPEMRLEDVKKYKKFIGRK